MTADDKLPSKICTDCKKQIVTFYTFKQKTKRTEESLLSMFAPEASIITEAAHCAMCNIIFESGDAYIEHVQQEHHDSNVFELENESAKMVRANMKEQEFEVYNIEENSDEAELITTDDQDMLAIEEDVKVHVPVTRSLRTRKGASKAKADAPSISAAPAKSKRNAKPPAAKATTSKMIYKAEFSDIDDNLDTNDSNYEYQSNESLECPYQCPLCDIQFTDEDEYIQHCKDHNDTQHQCEGCNEFFLDEDQFYQHDCEAVDKDESEEDLLCVPCNKRMKSTAQLRQHKKMHDSMSLIIDSMDFYPCHDCCLIFISKEKLNEHNGTVHADKAGKDLTNLSEKIDDSCTDYQFLDSDMLQMEYKENETYSCGECDLPFQTIIELKYHVILHSSKFQCPIDECGCQYDQMSRLSIHVLNKHINSKNLQCLHCSLPFQTYDDLQAHLKNFCKEKKFPCHECGMLLNLSTFK